jgi:hypothetical protein
MHLHPHITLACNYAHIWVCMWPNACNFLFRCKAAIHFEVRARAAEHNADILRATNNIIPYLLKSSQQGPAVTPQLRGSHSPHGGIGRMGQCLSTGGAGLRSIKREFRMESRVHFQHNPPYYHILQRDTKEPKIKANVIGKLRKVRL